MMWLPACENLAADRDHIHASDHFADDGDSVVAYTVGVRGLPSSGSTPLLPGRKEGQNEAGRNWALDSCPQNGDAPNSPFPQLAASMPSASTAETAPNRGRWTCG